MNISVEIIEGLPNLTWEREPDARSYELYVSINDGDYALINEPAKETTSFIDVRRAGILKYKIRKITAEKKGSYSTEVSYPYLEFKFTSFGTGEGVGEFNLEVNETVTAKLFGAGKFYTNEAATEGESSLKQFATGALRKTWIKIPSGESVMRIRNVVTSWGKVVGGGYANSRGWETDDNDNFPCVETDLSKITNLINVTIFGHNKVSGDITDKNMVAMEIACAGAIHSQATYGATATGVITGMSNLEYFDTWDLTAFTGNITDLNKLIMIWLGGLADIEGSIENLTALKTLIVNSNVIGFELSGSINGLANIENIVLDKPCAITGNVSTQTKLKIFRLRSTDNITVDNITNCPDVYIFEVPNKVLSESVVNQILADLWANRSETLQALTGTISLGGATGTSAPTGQGLIDKAALIEYYENWTINTR